MREHHAGQLTAGRALAQRSRGRAGVRDEQHLDAVGAVRSGLVRGLDDDPQLGAAHRQPGELLGDHGRDSRSAPPRRPAVSALGQRRRARASSRPRRVAQLRDPLVAAVEVEQPTAGGVRPGEHLGRPSSRSCASGCRARRADAARRRGAAGPPAGPPGSAASSVDDVREQVPGLGDARGQRGERRVVRALRARAAGAPARSCRRPRTPRRPRPRRRAPSCAPAAAVRRSSACASRSTSSASVDVLAGLRVDPLDLRQAEPQQLGLARPVPRAVDEVRRAPRRPARARPRRRGTRASTSRCAGPTNASSASRWCGGRPQPRLVGLPVHRDQLVGELGEHRLRDRPATDERARPARGAVRAAPTVRRSTRLPSSSSSAPASAARSSAARAGGQHDPPLDRRRRRPDAHRRRVRLAAEQQVERGEHHRLAGARLARQDRQPGPSSTCARPMTPRLSIRISSITP